MNIKEIDREISIRKLELEDEKKREAYDYMCDVIDEYELNNILDFICSDIWEIIKCNLYINCKYKDINKYCDLIEKFKDCFKEMKESYLEGLLGGLKTVYNDGKIDEIINYFKAKGLISEVRKMSLVTDNSYLAITLIALKKKLVSIDLDFLPFLELIKESGPIVIDIIKLYLLQESIRNFCDARTFEIDSNVSSELELELRQAAAVTRELKDFYDVETIMKRMSDIRSFKEEYERVERNNQKERNNLDSSRNELENSLDKKRILTYREIIKGIKSPKIKYLFLKYIKEHNEQYYEELLTELDRLKQDSKLSIQALLNDYGIPKDSYDYDDIPSYSKEELEIILKVLATLNITNEERLIIIQNTSIEKIVTIKGYLERGLIPIPFISNHIELLNADSTELDNLIENIDILKSKSIPLYIFLNSMELLLNNPSLILKNINILENYLLLNQLIKTSNLSFITSENLELVIDKYLELGYEKYLEEDLNILNNQDLDRLELITLIGLPFESKEELQSLLDEEKEFFVPLENISDYLPDESAYVAEPENQITLEQLEYYKATYRTYDFNGIKISVQKVSRLVANGYSLYQAIISNTHLREEELLTIAKLINNDCAMELKLI